MTEVRQIDSKWESRQVQISDADGREFWVCHTETLTVKGGPEMDSDEAIEAAMGGEQ